MSNLNFRKRRNRRGFFFHLSRHLPTFIVLFVIALVLGGGIFAFSRFVLKKQPGDRPVFATASEATKSNGTPSASAEADSNDPIGQLIDQADRLAKGYDYDKAMELLSQDPSIQSDPRISEALASFQSQKDSLVAADVKNVTHVFFHSLIMDTSKAFDGDSRMEGYNSVMTTKDEFLKILDALYNDGYVLVRIHDIAYETTDENGNPAFTWGTIMLPEGKKPIVMSQDDVCYYPYMDGDGFASKIVVGEDGRPTCEMKMDDGSISTGSYDMIPLLNDFIDEHPDFSYRGARAVIALTGYQGILGYRTASNYSDSPTYEADREQAAKVAQALRDNGWELASHSFGHLKLGVSDNPEKSFNGFAIEDERFRHDTDRWEAEVESLIGPTDIILYPFGNDIADFHAYTEDNPRFKYLESKGFRYFCNVDASTPYWMQKGTSYFRMARRNLDGYRLYQDTIQEDPAKKRLSDLFDARDIFDSARPTPVTWY